MIVLVMFFGATAGLCGLLLVITSGDLKHADRQTARARAERDLLRDRITRAEAAAAAQPPPLPRRPVPRTEPPLTDLEAQAWDEITSHLNLEQP